MKINIESRSIGTLIQNDKVKASVWSPKANEIQIITNNGSKIPMKKQDYGYWYVETEKLKIDDKYKFLINNEDAFPDPASLSQPEGVHGFSQVSDPEYQWNDKTWKNPDLADYIIYELHVGTFTEDGTFENLIEKIDYLSELGVNAIEIMPVAQFPGGRNWGYDGVFPFAVQHSYGGYKGLKKLIDTCHEKGLAVILDVVYNHLGPEGNYLNAYGPYFTDKYKTPWGSAVNFDDEWSDGVRQYVIENVLMWFRDFHIDALRLDAVHAIKDFSPKHILQEIKEYVNELSRNTGRSHYLIAECDLNDTRYIKDLSSGGLGMDAQWIDEFHHALRVSTGQEKTGYYSDFNAIAHLAKSYRDAYVYDKIYSPHRKRVFGTSTEGLAGSKFVTFSQNHDQVGNRMLGERTSELVSFEMLKLMAGAVMVSPFLPMLFMGEEWAASSRFQYFVSHSDENLIKAVREGRKAEFASFHAQGEAPDPQAEETFVRSKLNWEEKNGDEHRMILEFYQKLIKTRKRYKALHFLNRQNLSVKAETESKTILLHRWHGHEHVLIGMNFSGKNQKIDLSKVNDSSWTLILDSGDKAWGGPGEADKNIRSSETIRLSPMSILIYSNTDEV